MGFGLFLDFTLLPGGPPAEAATVDQLSQGRFER